MTLDLQQSSLFGGGWLQLTFNENIISSEADYYMVFEGQQERHVTKATVNNTKTIRVVIPEHHVAETVRLSAIAHHHHTNVRSILATASFTFLEDKAHTVTRHLVASVDNPLALEPRGQLKWAGFDLSGEDLTALDGQLLKVFLETKLPQDWNLLGDDYNLPEIPPRESLLHFTSRLGLQQLTEFFMYQPGSLDAVGLPNHDEDVPLDIAQDAGNLAIVNTLLGKNYYSAGGPPWLEKWKKPRPSTMVERHQNGLATITNDVNNSPRTIDDDIKLLHNMSRVVYDDTSLQYLHGNPPANTRYRHSMAEDHHRNKLYYPDGATTQPQRRSMAEQRHNTGSRLFDIDLQGAPSMSHPPNSQHHVHWDTPTLSSTNENPGPNLVSPGPRQGQGRRGINKPRLPSPHSERREYHESQQQPPPPPPPSQYPAPPRPSRVVSSQPIVHARQSSYERSRERRPISTSDTLDLEKQLNDDAYQKKTSPPYGTDQSVAPSVDPAGVYPGRRSDPSSRRRPPPEPPVRSQTNPEVMMTQQNTQEVNTRQEVRTRHKSDHDIDRDKPWDYTDEQSVHRQRSWDNERQRTDDTAQPADQHRFVDVWNYSTPTTSPLGGVGGPMGHRPDPPSHPPQFPTPYHPRSSSMDGAGTSHRPSYNATPTPQTNSLGRNAKRTPHSFSLLPQDGDTGLSFPPETEGDTKPQRPHSAGHLGQRTRHTAPPSDSPLTAPQSDRSDQQAPSVISHVRSTSLEGMESPRQNADSSKSELSECSDGSHDPGSGEARSQGQRYKKRVNSQQQTGSHHKRIYHGKSGSTAGSQRSGSQGHSQDEMCESPLDVTADPKPPVKTFSAPPPDGDTGQTVILEDNLRRLQEIQDNISKLRHVNGSITQNDRRDSLQRFSNSCPSLAEKLIQSVKVVSLDNTDSAHHKSMQELKRESQRSPPVDNHQRPHQADVQIYVNDVTVGASSDYSNHGDDPEMLLIEEMKRNQRRSSWCPEEERKKEEKSEKQRLLLGVCGRSQSLSSLEGDDDESNDESDDDLDSDTSFTPQHTSPHMGGGAFTPQHAAPHMGGGDANGSYLVTDHIQYMDEVDGGYHDDQHKDEAQSPPVQQPEILIHSPDGVSAHLTHSPTGGVSVPAAENLKQHRHSDGSVSPCSSAPSPHGRHGDNDVLSPSSTVLPKAASTPSINSHDAVEEKKRSVSTGQVSAGSPISKRSPVSPDNTSNITSPLVDNDRTTDNVDEAGHQVSMIEFLNDSNNFTDKDQSLDQSRLTNVDESQDQSHDQARGRDDLKDDKKRRSVFSKFPSYRGKKMLKENKILAPNSHQYVSVSFSNSTACDVCSKSMANKSALQCETHQRPLSAGNLKTSQSFKEPSRVIVPPPLQTSHSSAALPIPRSMVPANSSSSMAPQGSGQSPHGTGYFQWRRVATKLGIDKPVDDGPSGTQHDGSGGMQLAPETSNLPDVLSVSMESIEEEHVDGSSHRNFEVDKNLLPTDEQEAWSVTVDKKTLKKMSAKDIKRQDHIWELIQTEKSHCRTLGIMHKIFYLGLIEECDLGREMVDRIFPRLFDLLDIHLTFVRKLVKLQQVHADRSVDIIGELLYEQFGGLLGDQMKEAYGEFCSRHYESVQLYKDILKDNKKVQNFAKKCSHNPLCKRLDIPACILLVTQRTSKYPLLIESMLKATKDFQEERDNLLLALSAVRNILECIDHKIDQHEKYLKLIEIYNRVDARSYAIYKGSKFKKSSLLSNNRKLLHEHYVKWMNARGKSTEVLAVILSDVMFFLAENNGKFSFFSQDNKSSVISLTKLLVREKGDTKDSKGIYLICQSKTEPEMYELVCKSAGQRKYWIQIIKSATSYSPEEEAGAARDEEDRKLLEARSVKLRQLLDELRQRDDEIRAQSAEKIKLYDDMVDLFRKDHGEHLPHVEEERQELQNVDSLLQAAIIQGEKLMTLLQTLGIPSAAGSHGNSLNLSRSVSSAGEHSTGRTTPPLPKRAETFSGFENKENGRVKKRFPQNDGTNTSDHNLDVTDPGAMETNVKEKVHRRSSTSFLQNLLTKQHTDSRSSADNTLVAGSDNDSVRSSDSSASGSLLDLSGLSPAPSINNLALSREQCTCLAQLMTYVNKLAVIASHQSTETETFRAQLAEANAKISRLYSGQDITGEKFPGPNDAKRPIYHHDKQLEELRNLQEQLNQERSVFEKERTQQNLEIHQEKQDIVKERLDVDKQRSELKSQRDELQRQKEALQRQMDLFEEQKANFNKTMATTQAELVVAATKISPGQRERSESPASSGGGSLERKTHKRSGSNDYYHHSASREGSPFEGNVVITNKEPLNKLKTRSNSSGSSSKSTLPLHLVSATNEVMKTGHVTQKLPLKLAGLSSGGPKGSLVGAPPPVGLRQVLPFKLSSSTSTSQMPATRQATPPSNQYKQQLTHTKSQPALTTGIKKLASPQIQPGHTGGATNLLPMKLAERLSQPKPTPLGGRTRSGANADQNQKPTKKKKVPTATLR